MEGRRTPTSQRQLPQAAIVAAAAAAEALSLCARLRSAAADVPTCRRDCRYGAEALRPSVDLPALALATSGRWVGSRGGSCACHLARAAPR